LFPPLDEFVDKTPYVGVGIAIKGAGLDPGDMSAITRDGFTEVRPAFECVRAGLPKFGELGIGGEGGSGKAPGIHSSIVAIKPHKLMAVVGNDAFLITALAMVLQAQPHDVRFDPTHLIDNPPQPKDAQKARRGEHEQFSPADDFGVLARPDHLNTAGSPEVVVQFGGR
jgi:hypothetical protein